MFWSKIHKLVCSLKHTSASFLQNIPSFGTVGPHRLTKLGMSWASITKLVCVFKHQASTLNVLDLTALWFQNITQACMYLCGPRCGHKLVVLKQASLCWQAWYVLKHTSLCVWPRHTKQCVSWVTQIHQAWCVFVSKHTQACMLLCGPRRTSLWYVLDQNTKLGMCVDQRHTQAWYVGVTDPKPQACVYHTIHTTWYVLDHTDIPSLYVFGPRHQAWTTQIHTSCVCVDCTQAWWCVLWITTRTKLGTSWTTQVASLVCLCDPRHTKLGCVWYQACVLVHTHDTSLVCSVGHTDYKLGVCLDHTTTQAWYDIPSLVHVLDHTDTHKPRYQACVWTKTTNTQACVLLLDQNCTKTTQTHTSCGMCVVQPYQACVYLSDPKHTKLGTSVDQNTQAWFILNIPSLCMSKVDHTDIHKLVFICVTIIPSLCMCVVHRYTSLVSVFQTLQLVYVCVPRYVPSLCMFCHTDYTSL